MANKLTKISFRLRDNHRLSDTNYDSGPTGQFLKWEGEGEGGGLTLKMVRKHLTQFNS